MLSKCSDSCVFFNFISGSVSKILPLWWSHGGGQLHTTTYTKKSLDLVDGGRYFPLLGSVEWFPQLHFSKTLIIVISVLSRDGCSQQKWGCGLEKRAINRKNIARFFNRCSPWLKAWVYQFIERSICNIIPQGGIGKKIKKKPQVSLWNILCI